MKGVKMCPICNAPIQRMMDPKSDVDDGMTAHIQTVHPEIMDTEI